MANPIAPLKFSALSAGPPVSSQKVLRSEAEKRTEQVALERLFEGLNQMQRQGALDGEVLIARGDRPLLHLRSADLLLSKEEPQFMIGSVSKQFFAVTLLKVLYNLAKGESEQEKTIHVQELLQQPISYFLSEDAPIWSGKMPAWAKEISLHHLLTHTSGIPDYMDVADKIDNWKNTGKRFFEFPHSAGEVIEFISKEAFEKPGLKHSYSNTNYRIIGEIIAAITKMPASDYIQKELFEPAGLTSTVNPNSGKSHELRLNKNCSALVPEMIYDPAGDTEKLYPPAQYEDIGVAIGDGSIISTAQDLLKWNVALHENRSILPQPLYELFVRDHADGYCYGIKREERQIGLALVHDGNISSYRASLQYFVDGRLSIIVLSSILHDRHKADIKIAELMSECDPSILDEGQRKKKEIEIIGSVLENRGYGKIYKLLDEAFPLSEK